MQDNVLNVSLKNKAFVYDLLTHGGAIQKPSSIQQSPDIVIVVFPYKYKQTWDPSINAGSINRLQSMETMDPVFLDPECFDLKINSSKRNHVSALSTLLKDTENKILYNLMPGEWIFVWMMDNAEDANNIRTLIKNGRQANDFMSGLKFVGKISNIRESIQISPEGKKVRQVSLEGEGFSEFDSCVYFDPAMKDAASGASTLNPNVNVPNVFFLSGLLTGGLNLYDIQQITTVSGVIGKLLNIFIGHGPPSIATHGPAEGANKVSSEISPNKALLVPNVVSKILGRFHSDGSNYAKLLTAVFGVQKYNNQASDKISHPFPLMLPQGSEQGQRVYCPKHLTGKFSPTISPWPGVPLWSIFQSFLNQPVNEMYTCLRADYDGKITPHLIVRQIPLNTDDFVDYIEQKYKPLAATAFSTLPRWKADPLQVLSYSIGRSGSTRCNVSQIKPQPALASEKESTTGRTLIGIEEDRIDILRNGIYSFIRTLDVTESALTGGDFYDKFFSKVIRDRLFNGHLYLNGRFTLMGIQDPIVEGDNFQFENVVYHIEQVTHSFSVNILNGSKTFTTSLAVSHGIPITSENGKDSEYDSPRATFDG